MNKLLEKQATLLTQTFDDFTNFDFNKQLAEEFYNKYKDEIDATNDFDKFMANNDHLLALLNQSMQIMPSIPVFEHNGQTVVLKSARFFEISRYAISACAFVKGVDQFVSAEKLLDSKQYQFIVFAYYSAIFQLMTSFLALHGTVYIPKSTEGMSLEVMKKEDENNKVKEIIKFTPIGFDKFTKGVYTNGWQFTNIGSDHVTRWREFCGLLKLYLRNSWENQIPKGVVRFWGYVKVVGTYKQRFWDKDTISYEIAFKNKNEFISTLNQFYGYPPSIRHQKIYEDRHYDLFAWAYLRANQELPEDMKTAEQEFFRDCAKDLLLWQYKNLKETFDFVHLKCKEERGFFKGMNAIADTPEVRMLSYLRDSLYSEKILRDLGKDLPEFIYMLFT